MLKRKITFAFFLLFLFNYGYSQVIVQFITNYDNNFTLQNLWNFQLNNLSGNTINGYIEIKATNNLTDNVVSIQSARTEIQSGLNTPNNDLIKNSRVEFNKLNSAANSYKKDGFFPKGLYYICVIVKEAGSDAELGQNCTQANVTLVPESDHPSKSSKSESKSNFFSKNVKFSGYSEITGVYSNMQPYGSMVPASYLQWYLNPTLSICDFPISFQLLLSTRQNDFQQNINSFNVQFDAYQFMNILKQRALDFIKKKVNDDRINNMNVESVTDQFNIIKGKLESPGTLMELGQIKQLDSLKGSLNSLQNLKLDSSSFAGHLNKLKHSPGIDSIKLDTNLLRSKLDSLQTSGDSIITSKIDSLKKKIKVLSWLEEKRPYYEKLLKQKDELEGKMNSFNLDSLGGKVDDFKSQYDPQKLNDPNFLYGFLNKFGLFKKFEKVMMSVKKLSIGTSFPNYTDFTCKGVQVNGFNIELEKWNTNISFSYGNTLQGIMPSFFGATPVNTIGYTYQRNVIGGSIGYGNRDKSHIHFTLMSFDDDPTSINIPDSMIGIVPKPKSNQVLSTDFKLSLFKNKLSIYGELAGSQTVRNVTLIDSSFIINTTNYNSPKEWFTNIFLQRNVDLNTSVDFAFKAGLEAKFFKGATKVSTQVKRVGPGYISLGNPFMMRDMFNIEVKLSQTFWKKRITLSGFVRRNIDNLENTKLLTSQWYNFGFDATFNIPKWPMLRISMTPYVQSNDSTNMNINVLTANTSYIFKIKKLQLMTNLSYMHQNGSSVDSSFNFYSHYLTLLNTLLVSKSVSLSVTQNYFQINNRYGDIGTYALNLSGSVVAFKKWNSTIGGLITVNQNERRYGGYYQSSIQFLKYFTFSLRVEYNRYDIIQQTIYNNNIPFDQIFLRGVLITRW